MFHPNPGLTHQMRRRMRDLAEAAAILVKDEVKLQVEDAPPRTGRTYLVPGTRTPYTASAPGEPPAIREGRYRDSWKSTPGIDTPRGALAVAFSDLLTDDGQYVIGELLEYGSGSMAPRPHIRPAIELVLPKIRRLVRDAGR